MDTDDLSWEQVREGAAQGMAPVGVDPDTGLPVPTVSVSAAPAQPAIWPWVIGFGVLLWALSRR